MPPPKIQKEARADSSPDPSSARTKCKNKNQPRFCQILSPENSFGKTESAFRPATLPEYLEGRTPERKTPFPFSKEISPPPNQKCKECFFFRGCRVKRGGGGAIRRAYDFGQSHHALRAWHINRGSAGNESELFGIMTTIPNLKKD